MIWRRGWRGGAGPNLIRKEKKRSDWSEKRRSEVEIGLVLEK
jgi:hypothetical protein